MTFSPQGTLYLSQINAIAGSEHSANSWHYQVGSRISNITSAEEIIAKSCQKVFDT